MQYLEEVPSWFRGNSPATEASSLDTSRIIYLNAAKEHCKKNPWQSVACNQSQLQKIPYDLLRGFHTTTRYLGDASE